MTCPNPSHNVGSTSTLARAYSDESWRGATEPWLARRRFYNFAERDVDPVSFYAQGDYGRLAAIREEVDPHGLFQAKHTIV